MSKKFPLSLSRTLKLIKKTCRSMVHKTNGEELDDLIILSVESIDKLIEQAEELEKGQNIGAGEKKK